MAASTITGASARLLDLSLRSTDVNKGGSGERSIDLDNATARLGLKGGGIVWKGSTDDRTNERLPAADPTPNAWGASSNGGNPKGVNPATFAAFPDVLQLRAGDIAAVPSRGQFDPATQALINFGSPTATAGAMVQLDCRQVAAALGIQDVGGLQKAIIAAAKWVK